MQSICNVKSSFLGMLNYGGPLYAIVFAAKWAIICVSGNEPECGLKFWYQFVSSDICIVIVFGVVLAARQA